MYESPMKILLTELSGLYSQTVLRDIGETIKLYDYYDGKGQDWETPKNLDYTPTKKRVNLVKKLIKRGAGFMFGRTPEIIYDSGIKNDKAMEEAQSILSDVLERSNFQNKLIQAARDCFIGKRVALKLSGGSGKETRVSFRPAFEFVYSTADDDCDTLDKIIFFYQTNNEQEREKQRLWKQKYQMTDGRCHLTEGVYDGYGNLLEGGNEIDTGLDFIPCYVIINDGLTGDMMGESDVAELIALQDAYNKLNSDDADALKFNMFPQRVAADTDSKTLENIRISPGALVDLMTDPAVADSGGKADLKMLEASFNYSERFESTINRTKNDMYDLLSIPNISLEQLKGLMQSGKSMKALYWELITRCEEKWAAWEPALKWMANAVLKMQKVYAGYTIPENYTVKIEHLYPILEDDFDEMSNDMQEVAQQVRSRKSYIEKWGVAPDADEELHQIKLEQTLLQESYAAAIDDEINGGEVDAE